MADGKTDPLAALRAAGLKRQQEAEAAKAAEAARTRAALDALKGAAPTTPPAADETAAALDALRAEAPGDAPPATDETAAADDPLAGLDALLADSGADPAPSDRAAADPAAPDPVSDPPEDLAEALAEDPLAGLDDLLAEVPAVAPNAPAPEDDPLAGLDDLLDTGPAPEPVPAQEPDPAPAPAPDPAPAGPPQAPFGRLDAPRPDRAALYRPRFRIAVFGDFTGRAAAGRIETGAAIAGRRAIRLDVDTLDDVIAGFATTLSLPVTLPDGSEEVIAVQLRDIDDLHPDALYEALPLFSDLAGLRGQLTTAATSARAVDRLKGWGQSDGAGLRTRRRSAGSEMPADRRLSDFEALIGAAPASAAPTSTAATAGADRLIAAIVGPHVVAAPDPEARALTAAVDDALSSAMRLILHHPEFRALEAQWRSLDFLARRIETGADVEITLYDISAEELAADLAAQEDVGQSGLCRLVSEAALPEDQGGGGAGGFSALFGLYTFEETPPHAEILARIARIAAHVDAPFFAGLAPACLDTDLRDRHPLTDRAWRALRALPEAGHLGLALPRFLLRHPYGSRSDPIDAFAFEEFTPQAGLKSLPWAHPAVAVATLLAATRTQAAKLSEMSLGTVTSLGNMPFHHVTDAHGDQVALPCTERNLTLSSLEGATARGLMALVSPRGRDEVRLASFQSLAGAEILGPWAGNVPPASPAGPAPTLEMALPGPEAGTPEAAGSAPAATAAAADSGGADGLDDLDALLAGFEDTPAPGAEGGTQTGAAETDMDADLAALLEGL